MGRVSLCYTPRVSTERQHFGLLLEQFGVRLRHLWVADTAVKKVLLLEAPQGRFEVVRRPPTPRSPPGDFCVGPLASSGTTCSRGDHQIGAICQTVSGVENLLCTLQTRLRPPPGVSVFAEPAELLDYIIGLLLEPVALQANDVPLPWRVELKTLHKMQNQLQMVCLLGIIALCCKDVLVGTRNSMRNDFFTL